MFKKKTIIFIACISAAATIVTSGFYYLLLPRIKKNQELYIFKQLLKVSAIADKSLLKLTFSENESAGYFSNIKSIYKNQKTGDHILIFFGKGLWGEIEGAIALNSSLKIIGISFYQHQETPGLGGEISSDDFQQRFIDKSFLKNNKFQALKIDKPEKVTDRKYFIDAVSGATLTSRSVENLINSAVREFYLYLNR